MYGSDSLETINSEVAARASALGCSVDFFQSNSEGGIVDRLHSAMGQYDGLIINPRAHIRTTVLAIRDAIAAVKLLAIEVHLSNVYGREEFRHTSVIAPVCVGQIAGLGKIGYSLALEALMEALR